MGKILVIRGGAIGDFILTLPVLAAIKANLPNNRLEVLGYPRIADLAVVGGLADRVESIESRGVAGFFARNGLLNEYYAEYFSEFDLIISFLFDPDGFFEQNVARCSSAQFIAGPHRPDETAPLHATSCFLKPLERLAIYNADATPQLLIDRTENGPASKTKLAMSSGTWLAVHPGSGSAKKNWPETHWQILLGHLMDETDCKLLLVGGEAEENRLERLSRSLPGDRLVVADGVSLPDLAQLLGMATGFIGHDSGISHLAAAVGRPGILLWGETSVEIWRPPSLQFELIHNPDGLNRIQPAEIFDACLTRWLK
jgi:heptosyltransferase-3